MSINNRTDIRKEKVRNGDSVANARHVTTNEAFSEILDAAKSGAEWAWEDLYRELAGPVTAYLRSRGAADPDDVASETFLQVARNIKTFDGDYESFRSWIFVIAHRRLLDSRRAISRRPKTVSDDARLYVVPDVQQVDAEAMDLISTARMEELFDRLTENQRDVLALRVIGDLTVEQTADALGKRVGAVKALQRRALASLRRVMSESGVPV
jgi:RNA polymerase sigma-70 factor (ECF subfamily)